jgi:ligand-binding SRPBCC domain-containing protein
VPKIIIHTNIKASAEIVFDLSRSIDLHKLSTAHTNEEAIAGRTKGLIQLNESVTWRAKHLGIYQKLTSEITAFKRPDYFVDEMVKGAFKSFRHEHHFEKLPEGTIMTDVFVYTSPLGFLGRMADVIFLKKYLTKLLINRNAMIKEFAESEKYKELLKCNK